MTKVSQQLCQTPSLQEEMLQLNYSCNMESGKGLKCIKVLK